MGSGSSPSAGRSRSVVLWPNSQVVATPWLVRPVLVWYFTWTQVMWIRVGCTCKGAGGMLDTRYAGQGYTGAVELMGEPRMPMT